MCKDFFWVFQSPFNFTKYSFPKIRFAFLWMREKEGWLVGWNFKIFHYVRGYLKHNEKKSLKNILNFQCPWRMYYSNCMFAWTHLKDFVAVKLKSYLVLFLMQNVFWKSNFLCSDFFVWYFFWFFIENLLEFCLM